MYHHTSEMISTKKQDQHRETILNFLKTHTNTKAVDIAEKLYSTLHMSVGEVQLYLGELIDQHQVAIDEHGRYRSNSQVQVHEQNE